MDELWGSETRKAIENFQVSGEPILRHVARWLGRIKLAAARVNAELGLHDDVNWGQSSNDVFPSAVHLAALDQLTSELLPALSRLAQALESKAKEFEDVVKSGRTPLMDAVPVTLGQEFAGYAAQVRQGIAR